MINLENSINNLKFRDSENNEEGYDVEYNEHYESILKLVDGNIELAKKIVMQIVKDHKKESKKYYTYLEEMERKF